MEQVDTDLAERGLDLIEKAGCGLGGPQAWRRRRRT
jgi:hypothetical protein